MLRPDPAQHSTAQQAGSDHRLSHRAHRRSPAHGWVGEVDGLQASLNAARLKLVQMQRTATNLGMPRMPR